MRIVKVRNNTSSTKTWMNKEYSPSEEYTLPEVMISPYSRNDTFLAAIANGEATIGNSDSWITGITQQIEWLKGDTLIVSDVPEPKPFAQPTYRTKRSATSSLITVSVNSSADIDFKLLAERYVSGGVLIVENAKFGDYVTAEVVDIDGVIPTGYRSSLCENWPTVAKYIEKEFVEVEDGLISRHKVDTFPLNAKITAGLYLRVTYFAVNEGSNRRVAMNYLLSKKL